MSSVNNILQEAVSDLVRAFSYETNLYLKKEGEAGRSKLHSSENWKPIFDKVAHRYVEDLRLRDLNPKKRVDVDMNTLVRSTKSNNKYLLLLKNREEIQNYLRKQIKFITDEASERIEKYRNPKEYINLEKEISTTTPTPRFTKAEQQIKDAEVGLSKIPVHKKGSERHFGGIEFEHKVAKAMAKNKIDKVKWINNKISIEFPGTGSIADKLYEMLKKNPSKTISYEDVYKIANSVNPSVSQMSKYDFEFDDIKYELKKQNLYEKSIFGEVWKIANEGAMKKMVNLLGSEERARLFYNNFIQKIASEPLFMNKIIQAVRTSMIKNNIHIIGLCGNINSKTEVGIFSPHQLEFTVGLGGDRMGTKRFTIFVNAKKGISPTKVIGKYGDLEESMKIYLFTDEVLLKENVRIK
jgi:hypothetical protein